MLKKIVRRHVKVEEVRMRLAFWYRASLGDKQATGQQLPFKAISSKVCTYKEMDETDYTTAVTQWRDGLLHTKWKITETTLKKID